MYQKRVLNFSLSLLKLIIFIVFVLNIGITGKSKERIETRITFLLESEIELDSLKSIINDIVHKSDTAYLRKQLERIIEVTSKKKNSKTYVFTLKAYGQLNNSKTMRYLNEAYKIAKDNNYLELLGDVVDTKGSIFKEKGMYDSLIVTLLEAREIYEKSNNNSLLVPILHNTADLYFSVKLYDKAEKLYLEILEKKGDLEEWGFWRNIVIVNNLGLIEFERGKYDEALKYFEQSHKIITTDSTNSRFKIALGYNTLQFSKCYLKMGNDSLAQIYYEKSIVNCIANSMYYEIISLYNIKSELFYRAGKIDSSLFYTKKAFEIFENNNISKSKLIPIYSSFFTIFQNKGNYKVANTYLNLLANLKDSINNSSQMARQMQVLAENDYQKSVAKINILKVKNFYLLLAVIAVLVFLIIIFMNYFKLKNVYKKLINKNLELVGAEVSLSNSNNGDASNVLFNSENVTLEEEELIKNLEELMQSEKAFLLNEISINEVAQKLNTNRTYLSRAINLSLKKSFVVYVNQLRIKEAIKGISSGKYKDITIEGISVDVGFNNRISFNSAFKKYTGVLPSYFINEISKRG